MSNLDIISIVLIAALLAHEIKNFIGRSKKDQVAQVKEIALKLFMLAEKQELIGTEKMKWVSEEIFKIIPSDIIKKFISEKDIETWLQKVYNEARHELIEELEPK